MKQIINKQYLNNNIIFVSLILLTLLTWLMGKADISLKLTFVILLITAIIKIQLIGDFFMQLHTVSGFWRWIISLWALITCTLITVAFYL